MSDTTNDFDLETPSDEDYNSLWDALERGFNESAAEAAKQEETTMKIRVSYYDPNRSERVERELIAPDGVRPQSIRCRIDVPVVIHEGELDIIRVRFPGNHKEYCYRFDLNGLLPQPGDYVLAPANAITPHPSVVRVSGYGRNDYTGAIHARVTPLPKEA